MFGGVYANFNSGNENVADIGARRVLGVNGSVTNYIHTGNAGNKKALRADEFISKEQKKAKIDKAIKIAVAAGATIGALFSIFTFKKSKNTNGKNILKKAINRIKALKLKGNNGIKNPFKFISAKLSAIKTIPGKVINKFKKQKP